MKLRGYAKAEIVDLEESRITTRMFTPKGDLKDDHTIFAPRQKDKSKITYVHPNKLNTTIDGDWSEPTFYKGSKYEAATYTLIKPYGASNGENRFLITPTQFIIRKIKSILNY